MLSLVEVQINVSRMPCVVIKIGSLSPPLWPTVVRHSTVPTESAEFLYEQIASPALNRPDVPPLSLVTTLLVLKSELVLYTLATLCDLVFKNTWFPRFGTRSCVLPPVTQLEIKLQTGAPIVLFVHPRPLVLLVIPSTTVYLTSPWKRL